MAQSSSGGGSGFGGGGGGMESAPSGVSELSITESVPFRLLLMCCDHLADVTDEQCSAFVTKLTDEVKGLCHKALSGPDDIRRVCTVAQFREEIDRILPTSAMDSTAQRPLLLLVVVDCTGDRVTTISDGTRNPMLVLRDKGRYGVLTRVNVTCTISKLMDTAAVVASMLQKKVEVFRQLPACVGSSSSSDNSSYFCPVCRKRFAVNVDEQKHLTDEQHLNNARQKPEIDAKKLLATFSPKGIFGTSPTDARVVQLSISEDLLLLANDPLLMKEVLRRQMKALSGRSIDDLAPEGAARPHRLRPSRHLVEDARRSGQILDDLLVQRSTAAYQEHMEKCQHLPAYTHADEVMDALDGYQVVVVQAPTGTGKSVLLPKMWLDRQTLARKGAQTAVVVTEPRRLAAVFLANWVAAKNGDPDRLYTGYQTQFVKELPANYGDGGTLLYMTEEGLFERMKARGDAGSESLIVLDEVHERSITVDALLALLIDQLKSNLSLKLMIMTANDIRDTFMPYFAKHSIDAKEVVIDAPLPRHQVTVHHLDAIIADLLERRLISPIFGGPVKMPQESAADWARETAMEDALMDPNDDYSRETVDYVLRVQQDARVPVAVVVALLQRIIGDDMAAGRRGGTAVVLLAGVKEIDKVNTALTEKIDSNAFPPNCRRPKISFLYGRLDGDSQQDALLEPADGEWNVLLATNIAETSLTIPKCRCLIDCGYQKLPSYDTVKLVPLLCRVPVTKDGVVQRSGRLGRTEDGELFRLFTKLEHKKFEQSVLPAIQRCDLASLMLSLNVMGINCSTFFRKKMISAPSEEQINAGVKWLKLMGAISPTGQLTRKGEFMGRLGMHPTSANLLLHSAVFKNMPNMIVVVAALEGKPPLSSPLTKADGAKALEAKKPLMAGMPPSDYVLWHDTYGQFNQLIGRKIGRDEMRQWAKDNFADREALGGIAQYRHRLEGRLLSGGEVLNAAGWHGGLPNTFVAFNSVDEQRVCHSALYAAIAGGLFFNSAMFVKNNAMLVDGLRYGKADVADSAVMRLIQHEAPGEASVKHRMPFVVSADLQGAANGRVKLQSASLATALHAALFATRLQLRETAEGKDNLRTYFLVIEGARAIRIPRGVDAGHVYTGLMNLRQLFRGSMARYICGVPVTEHEGEENDVIDAVIRSLSFL